jgi:hypothetical protein
VYLQPGEDIYALDRMAQSVHFIPHGRFFFFFFFAMKNRPSQVFLNQELGTQVCNEEMKQVVCASFLHACAFCPFFPLDFDNTTRSIFSSFPFFPLDLTRRSCDASGKPLKPCKSMCDDWVDCIQAEGSCNTADYHDDGT